MPTYKTPGVYVEEISSLPPSVAEVSTAVPAFLGYTEKGYTASGPAIARVNTLLEYEDVFGGAQPSKFSVVTAVDSASGLRTVESVTRQVDAGVPDYSMYYCLSHYFKNGGGSCWAISVGDYTKPLARADFEAGLALLEKEDEPTLILLTDAVQLAVDDYYSLCQQVLAQCAKLGDRFGIFDVRGGDVQGFRDKIGVNDLMYGAAYHPYLNTTLNFRYRDEDVAIEGLEPEATTSVVWQGTFGDNGVTVSFTGAEGDEPGVKIVLGDTSLDVTFELSGTDLTIRNVTGETGTDVWNVWTAWKADTANDPGGFEIAVAGDGTGDLPTTNSQVQPLDRQTPATPASTLASIRSSETGLYNSVETALSDERVTLPPSSALAGVYAGVDRDRGVWKAPANVSLASVVGPTAKITDADQEGLNVDPTGGKSVNAVRAFNGKGTLVWGARTLAGNDNEWRYVSVRRLFNMIEESTKKSTSFAVFEPNDQTTWLKVKGMIDNYLYGLWEQGALAGSKPEDAYYVNVGLGKTMTSQDVLEGRMIVEIGVAAVRPAEFIVLRFTHKLQES